MKTTIVSKEVNEVIDWSIPQWVESDGTIVFTNGKHSGNTFQGIMLPCKGYLQGEFSRSWAKVCFKPIPKDGLTIHIQND